MQIIRKEQMAAFAEASKSHFETQLIDHLSEKYPENLDKIGSKDAVRHFVNQGINAALGFHIESERDIADFVSILIENGDKFYEKESMKAAKKILQEPYFSGREKMSLLNNFITEQKNKKS